MKVTILGYIILSLFIFSCGKDEDEKEETKDFEQNAIITTTGASSSVKVKEIRGDFYLVETIGSFYPTEGYLHKECLAEALAPKCGHTQSTQTNYTNNRETFMNDCSMGKAGFTRLSEGTCSNNFNMPY